jgi:hypothetical protein
METSMIDVDQLRKRYAAGGTFTPTEWTLLTAANTWAEAPDPGTVIELHDLLLFIKAFPHRAQDRTRAVEGLQHLTERAAQLAADDTRFANALHDSGLDGQPMHAHLSFDLCRWLVRSAPDMVHTDGFAGEDDVVRSTLLALSLQLEREAMDDARHTNFERLLVASNGAPLPWLIHAIDRTADHPLVRNALWEALRPHIVITPQCSPLARTCCEGIDDPLHFFPQGTRAISGGIEAIHRPMPVAIRLNARQRNSLVTAARGVLVGHQRETDPVSLVDPRALSYHRMAHGIGVLLTPLPPGRRTAFDAYVGYVAFANNVPVAYGGAWVFPGKTKVGINVFPAFRGGPSAILFAQILRCYAQRHNVGTFEAENYQLGHGNSDGIRSGAYWFYHRLGFRTMHPRLAAVAAAEVEHMRNTPGHRTPATVLRRLASEPMLLHLRPEQAPRFEPLDLAERVLRHLGRTADGDRSVARERITARVARLLGIRSMRAWSAADTDGFAELAPAIDLIDDLRDWSVVDKRRLVTLMCAKGALTEDRYIRLLRGHRRLLEAWAQVVTKKA